MTEILALLLGGLPLATALAVQLGPSPRAADRINAGGSLLTVAAAAIFTIHGFTVITRPAHDVWYTADAASCVMVAVGAVVGALSGLISPAYLDGGSTRFPELRGRRHYYAGLQIFWGSILILPLLSNLGLAWLTIEISTGSSALLVGFSGRATALEAGWKYLVLTTFGLAVALLGVVVLYASVTVHGGALRALDFNVIAAQAEHIARGRVTLAFLLIIAGLAAKIGWAPVHNWLPDAHSEAPPPVSAMLSAALLPAVIVVAWRTLGALSPALEPGIAHALFLGFGLCSLALAVPFLWRRQPLKRLLAYSSLEHMGVIAIGIGFGSPLALAGVVLHLAGHALAKSLGFYCSIPLLRGEPAAAREPACGLVRASPRTATALGISLGTLSGIPPSPLFFSELLILLGGFQSGHAAVAVIAALLTGLGFLGLSHTLLETLLGESDAPPWPRALGVGALTTVAVAVGGALIALSGCAFLIPGWSVVEMLTRLR